MWMPRVGSRMSRRIFLPLATLRFRLYLSAHTGDQRVTAAGPRTVGTEVNDAGAWRRWHCVTKIVAGTHGSQK